MSEQNETHKNMMSFNLSHLMDALLDSDKIHGNDMTEMQQRLYEIEYNSLTIDPHVKNIVKWIHDRAYHHTFPKKISGWRNLIKNQFNVHFMSLTDDTLHKYIMDIRQNKMCPEFCDFIRSIFDVNEDVLLDYHTVIVKVPGDVDGVFKRLNELGYLIQSLNKCRVDVQKILRDHGTTLYDQQSRKRQFIDPYGDNDTYNPSKRSRLDIFFARHPLKNNRYS